jgi:hypothetical protein
LAKRQREFTSVGNRLAVISAIFKETFLSLWISEAFGELGATFARFGLSGISTFARSTSFEGAVVGHRQIKIPAIPIAFNKESRINRRFKNLGMADPKIEITPFDVIGFF